MKVTIYSAVAAFAIVLLLGPIIIPMLKKFKFGQNIREDGPKSHQKKSGTPTMGGVIFSLAIVITTLAVAQKISGTIVMVLVSTIGFGLIGFLDDALKIKRKKNLGLRAYQKLAGQLLLGFILALYAYNSSDVGSSILIPFTHSSIDLGIWYIPFTVLFVACTTNGVNLTDGLDGLASGVTTIISVFFAVIAYSLGNNDLSIFCGALSGSLLGFLKFNSYPAEVFMGDTGSLALGGAISAAAILLKLPLIIMIVGLIYVYELLSVVIQVTSFKLTGKRVFKMAPVHHHYEQNGWHETKIVAWFCIFTAIFCLFGFLAISF